MNKSTITFQYVYPEGVVDMDKLKIDDAITFMLTKTFWKAYHAGLITDFHLIDEDMTPLTGEEDDEDEL